jgi:hypothetical protein
MGERRMNVRAKISFIVIITLIIGIVIGGLAYRILVQKRIEKVFLIRHPDYIAAFYERALELGPEQSSRVREILNQNAQTVAKIRTNFQEEVQSAHEALREELDPLLTPEQKQRLERGPLDRRMFRKPDRKSPPPSRMGRNKLIREELQGLKERLSLSKEQMTEVEKILAKSKPPMRKLRGGSPSLIKISQLWKEMEKVKDTAIEKVLNDDQKKIYTQIKQERRERIKKMILE